LQSDIPVLPDTARFAKNADSLFNVPASRYAVYQPNGNLPVSGFVNANGLKDPSENLIATRQGGVVRLGSDNPNDTCALFVAGTRQVTVKPNGQVGIGVDNPSLRLEVNGAIAAWSNDRTRRFGIEHDGTSAKLSSTNTADNISFVTGGTTRLHIKGTNGYVGIGTFSPGYKLDVSGDIRATGSIYYSAGQLPDYVFESGYPLMTIDEVEAYIRKNGHLPGVVSAGEAATRSLNIAEMNNMLLQKIEELTLYIIELKRETRELSKIR